MPKSTALQRIAASLGLTLERRNPEIDHPAFQLWFRAKLSNGADAFEILRRLEQSAAVVKAALYTYEPYPNLLARGWTIATPI